MNTNRPFAGFPSIEEYIKERNAPGISLAEAKTLAIPHDPLCRVEYASSRSGMAINDSTKTGISCRGRTPEPRSSTGKPSGACSGQSRKNSTA